MKLFKSAALALAVAACAAAPAAIARQRPIETYYASLSAWDHHDFKGHRFESAAAILRQDRANFHNFHLRDPSDTGEDYFRDAGNRARLGAMLQAGDTSPHVIERIRSSQPRVRVEVYADRVDVTIETNEGAVSSGPE